MCLYITERWILIWENVKSVRGFVVWMFEGVGGVFGWVMRKKCVLNQKDVWMRVVEVWGVFVYSVLYSDEVYEVAFAG